MNFNLIYKQNRLRAGLFLSLILCIGLISCQKTNTPSQSSQNKANTPDPRDAIVGNYAAIDTIVFWGNRINSTYSNFYYIYNTTLSITKDPANSSNIILSETPGGDTKTWYGMNVTSGGNTETCFNISDQYFTSKKGLKYYIIGSTFFATPPSGGIYDEYFYGKTISYLVTGNVSNYMYQGKTVVMPYTEKIVVQ